MSKTTPSSSKPSNSANSKSSKSNATNSSNSTPSPSSVEPTNASPSQSSDQPSAVPETTEITPRPVLNLQHTPKSAIAVARQRPIDPSPVQVSYTVSLAGTRPVMRSEVHSPTQVPLDFTKSPRVMNRPVAPNTTEDSTKMLEYLD
ncbi:MAG: hypothetical protein ACO4AJ_03265 [Prochlorothrix sp.]